MPAELVAYSGFSPTNYIQEPYSPDLDFGTGEWSVGSWVNVPTALTTTYRDSFPTAGSNVVLNGDFSAGSADWILGTGWSISNGVATHSGTSQGNLQQNVLTAGVAYRITMNVSAGTVYVYAGGSSWAANLTGVIDIVLVASASQLFIQTAFDGTTVDNVSYVPLGSAQIAERSYISGPSIKLGLTPSGYLTTTAHDGTTTLTTTTTTAYNTGTWIKASANYTTDGTLSIDVNGNRVASTYGTPLKSLSSRYNLLNYSEQFDNAAWSKTKVVVTSNTAIAPDSFTTADLITADGVTGSHYVAYNTSGILVQTGEISTYSVYVKADTSQFVQVAGANGFQNAYFNFDLQNGVLGDQGYYTTVTPLEYPPIIETMGNGWYRLGLTTTQTVQTGKQLYLRIAASLTDAYMQSDNLTTGVYAWGAQLTTGSTSLPYQRTTTVAETGPLAPLTIGNSYALDAPFPGSLALLKLSATVPTAEQSQWMYEQEKMMFQPEAKCCLPDSGALLDLAYDDATDSWVTVSATNESTWNGLVRTGVTPVPAGSYSKVSVTSGVKLEARTTTNPGVDITVPDYNLREKMLRPSVNSAQSIATFDYVGGFTATTTTGSTSITSVAGLSYPTSYVGAVITGTGIPAGAYITAISGTTIYISAPATATGTAVQISFTDFILPVGMTAKLVMSLGVLKQEGSTKDYTKLFDGFKETVRFAVAPGYTTWVQLQAVKG